MTKTSSQKPVRTAVNLGKHEMKRTQKDIAASNTSEQIKRKKPFALKVDKSKKVVMQEYDSKEDETEVEDADLISVESGVLDEDICWACGASTGNPSEYDEVLICDICSGEYHLSCINLSRVPRSAWACSCCKTEYQKLKPLRFSIRGRFRVPRKNLSRVKSLSYNPGKPLHAAMLECSEKGVMIVKNVFNDEVLR